jgi:hypothetical protein
LQSLVAEAELGTKHTAVARIAMAASPMGPLSGYAREMVEGHELTQMPAIRNYGSARRQRRRPRDDMPERETPDRSDSPPATASGGGSIRRGLSPLSALVVSACAVTGAVVIGQVDASFGDLAISSACVVLLLAVAFVGGRLAYHYALRDDHMRFADDISQANSDLRRALAEETRRTFADVKQQVEGIQATSAEILDCISHIPDLPHWSAKSPLVTVLNGNKLKTAAEAAEYEDTVNCDEIWISTRDLAKDLASVTKQANPETGAVFEHIVERNIRDRGRKYVYLFPDVPANRHYATHELATKFEDFPELIQLVLLSEDDWLRMPYCDGDFALYISDHGVSAHFEFPWSDRQLWIDTPPDMAREWAGRVAQIRDDALDKSR